MHVLTNTLDNLITNSCCNIKNSLYAIFDYKLLIISITEILLLSRLKIVIIIKRLKKNFRIRRKFSLIVKFLALLFILICNKEEFIKFNILLDSNIWNIAKLGDQVNVSKEKIQHENYI